MLQYTFERKKSPSDQGFLLAKFWFNLTENLGKWIIKGFYFKNLPLVAKKYTNEFSVLPWWERQEDRCHLLITKQNHSFYNKDTCGKHSSLNPSRNGDWFCNLTQTCFTISWSPSNLVFIMSVYILQSMMCSMQVML